MEFHTDALVRVRSASRAPFAPGLWAATLLGAAACTAPSTGTTTGPLDHLDARERLAARSDPQELDRALRTTDLHRAAFTLPADPIALEPADPAFWLVRALAWSPDVRAASRRLLAAMAESRSAGAPLPVELQLMDHEFGGADGRLELAATIDLLGILGIGPARTDRERATAAAALAAAELEAEIWRAWRTVDAARLSFQAAATRERVLAQVHEQARADLERVTILHDQGWIGAAPAAAARAAVGRVERARSAAAVEAAEQRADLAHATGLPPEDEAFSALLDRQGTARGPALRPGSLPDESSLADHPRLRALRTLFALREAEVRDVAARAWPNIGIGPRLGYEDDLTIGGVLRLTLPFPSSWRGRLAGAVEERDAVLEAYEDALHLLIVEERSARERRDELHRRTVGATARVVDGSSVGWSAARAAFRVGRTGVPEWIDALDRRLASATAEVDDVESLALAQLDLAAVLGPLGTRLPWQDGHIQEVTP